ncbi:reverse transcriptase domain-containing protein [Tanacetum coccineum]|uniref:Reverse transcriptase domain-containing protein n=1 Tax=Tanacetum coccineum TaxID=301880 RepID=A0ABQ5BQN8_9ASTR
MADDRPMAEQLQAPTGGFESAIVVPIINAQNFELKSSLINLVQNRIFRGGNDEEPHAHIRHFESITNNQRTDVPNTTIKLILFPFSLDGVAKTWLDKEPPNSISLCGMRDAEVSTNVLHLFFFLHHLTSNIPTNGSGLEIRWTVTVRNEMILTRKNMMKALVPTPTPIKAVEERCTTCGSNHSYNVCPMTRGGYEYPVYHDNFQQFQQTASVGNFVQNGNSGYRPPNLANQIRPPGFNQQNNNRNVNANQGYNRTGNNGNQVNHGANSGLTQQAQAYQAPRYSLLFCSDGGKQAFNDLRKKLIESPILVVPNWDYDFEIMCDASDFALGAVLGQRKDKHFHPIHYARKDYKDKKKQKQSKTDKERKNLVPDAESSQHCIAVDVWNRGRELQRLLLAEEKFLKIKQVVEEEQTQPEYLQALLQSLLKDLQILNEIQPLKQDISNQIQKDQRKKIEDMSIEEMIHEQQLVDREIKEIINDLGYKRFRGEEIDEEYERDCEIRIQKLKQDFNIWGSEVRKKEKAYEDEKYAAACRYMLSVTCDDDDDDNLGFYAVHPNTIHIPVSQNVEPKDSLIMGDGHINTTPETETNSVETLVSNPSESDDFSLGECDLFDIDDSYYEKSTSRLAHLAPLSPEIVEVCVDDDDTDDDRCRFFDCG